MNFAVVGAGAIGGYFGARLALAGEDVTFIARGASLDAIRRSGFTLIEVDGSRRKAGGRAVSIDEASVYDVVVLALKAHQISAVAEAAPRLFHPGTVVVTLQNGVPWWYFYKIGGPFEGMAVRAADPGGVIAANIEYERIVGGVVYAAAEHVAPGVVKVIEGRRFSLGEPDGSSSERVQRISAVLTRAGFHAPVSPDIRAEIWGKVLGNVSLNPISALTHATLASICRHPEGRALAEAMMGETRLVAEKLGVRFLISVERRMAGAEAVGEHKTSMLQDVEAGRDLELEPLVGSVMELARLTDTPTPYIDAVYSCVKLLGKTLADARGQLRVEPRP